MIQVPHSYPFVPPNLQKSLTNVLDQAFLSQNPTLRQSIEKKLAGQYGFTYATLVPSASSGFLFLLLALNIRKGDEVVLSAINCPSMLNMIRQVGATPVIADVRSTTDFRANAQVLSACVNQQTRLVVVTHMFGVLVEFSEIALIKSSYPQVLVLEDFSTVPYPQCALNSISDFGLLSFGGTKPIAVGNGGAVLSRQNWFTKQYSAVQIQATYNTNWSNLDLQVLQAQLMDSSRQSKVRNRLKQWYQQQGIRLFGQEFVLFRAITFESIDPLRDKIQALKIELDIRESVQPNLAKELSQEPPNALQFKNYVSLPLNDAMYAALLKVDQIEVVDD